MALMRRPACGNVRSGPDPAHNRFDGCAPGTLVLKDFIIRRHRPVRYRLHLALLCAVLLALFGYEYGKAAGWHLRWSWNADTDSRDQDAKLREKLLILERNNELDRQAAALLQQQLIDAQKENFQLRKELEFYQGIIHSKRDGETPVLHRIRIKPLLQARAYRLELILLHITDTDKVFSGTLDITLEGVQGRETTRLALSQLSSKQAQQYKVSFRNFQRFEDNFVLPDGFEPRTALVTLSLDGQQESGFEKVFDWPLTENGEIADVRQKQKEENREN